nr:hypothetical protein [Mycobacterium florentinum]
MPQVIDDAQAVPQRGDELAVDEVAPTRIDPGSGLDPVDEQAQPFTPGVVAEVVEPGAFAGAGDELVGRRGRVDGERRRHSG